MADASMTPNSLTDSKGDLVEPVAWRGRRQGSSEWVLFSYDPAIDLRYPYTEPLVPASALTAQSAELASLRVERDARLIRGIIP